MHTDKYVCVYVRYIRYTRMPLINRAKKICRVDNQKSWQRMLHILSNLLEKCFSSIITRNDTKWKQNGITIAGGNGIGNQSNQFNFSFGIHVDDDGQNVYITDFNNNRVIQGKFAATNVEVVVGGNRDGYQLLAPTHAIADQKNDSLIICDAGNRRVMRWFRQNGTNPQILLANIDCYGLAMDKKGHLYVSDYIKNEVRRWEETVEGGMIVAGGNEQGNNYTQLDRPGYIFVNHNYSVYVSDRNNHRVMKWMQDAKEGSVVAGGHGEGHNLTQLASPQGLTVDKLGNIYVADLRNHRVMRWVVNAEEGRVIAGGNGEGQQANQLLYPTGMSWDFEGNLYVADCSNNRVQRFDIDVD